MKRLITIFFSTFLFLLIICLMNYSYAVEEPWKLFDLDGETFRFWIYDGVTPFGIRDEYSWSDPSARIEAHIKEVEEMFNCKIEYVPLPRSYYTNPQELIMEIMAGESRVDFFQISRSWGFHNFALEGLLLPLDEYLYEPYDFIAKQPESFGRPYKIAGITFGIDPIYYALEPSVVIWNKPLFEAEGMPSLYEIYENGEWTWETMKEIAQAFNKDTTGDGVYDQVGIPHDYRRVRQLLFTNNSSYTKNVDGRIEFALDQPEAIEVLEFWQEFTDEVFTDNADYSTAPASYAMEIDFAHQLRQEHRYPGWGLVPLPRGPRAEEHVVPMDNSHMGVIPITAKHDPRAILEIMSALMLLTEPYIDGPVENREEHFWNEREMWVSDRKSLEIWKWLAKNVYDPELAFPIWREVQDVIVNDITTEKESVSASIDAIKSKVQAFLDEILRQ